jgi:serine protease Do
MIKKTMKGFLVLILAFTLVGCGKDNQVCDCPENPINTEEIFVETTNELSTLYAEKVTNTATVLVYDTAYNLASTGSAFVYKEDANHAYLITNTHVIENHTNIELLFSNKTRQIATVVEKSVSEDIAVLRIAKSDNYTVADLGDSSLVERGNYIFTIGSPLGIEYAGTITSGVVSGVDIMVSVSYAHNNLYLIQIDAPINPGNSGGPLYNLQGQVIGVNTLKINKIPEKGDAVESFNYAIPINFAVNVADLLIINRDYTRPGVDMTFVSIPSLTLAAKSSEGVAASIYTGLLVKSVVPNGNVATKGVTTNMIITKINEKNVKTSNDFYVELYKYNVGDKVTITTTALDGTNPQEFEIQL